MNPKLLLFVFSLSTMLACSGSTSGSDSDGGECSAHSDCDSGFVCETGSCVQVCNTNADCSETMVCGFSNICITPETGVLPEITSVEGNGAAAQTVVDGIIIRGRGLGDVNVELVSSARVDLAIRTQGADRVEVILPTDIISGDYALVVTNAAGTAQASTTLTLPELDGDTLLGRLNNDATGTLAVGLLPVGTGSTEIAAGNHAHSDYFEISGGSISGDLAVTGTTSLDGALAIGASTASAALSVNGLLNIALAGVVGATGGNVTLTGSGTAFVSELNTGDAILVDGQILTVQTIVSDTSLELMVAPTSGFADATAYRDGALVSVKTGDDVSKFSVGQSGDLFAGGATTRFANAPAVYRWYLSNSGSFEQGWQTIAHVSLPNAQYSAVLFEVEITNPTSNHGASAVVDSYTYHVSMRRSSGTVDNLDDAVLVGPNATFVRAMKLSLGVYELQVRRNVLNQSMHVEAQVLAGNTGAVRYVSDPLLTAAADTGTEYLAP